MRESVFYGTIAAISDYLTDDQGAFLVVFESQPVRVDDGRTGVHLDVQMAGTGEALMDLPVRRALAKAFRAIAADLDAGGPASDEQGWRRILAPTRRT